MHISKEQVAQQEVERYERYRLFEEKTDIGERLTLPIENHSTLEVVEEAVYGRDTQGELRRMTDWSREAYEAALRDPGFSGANAVERIRRRHEYDEACDVERLMPGEQLIVFSPIPDAAMEGALTIQGYRTDLARTFCRLYYRDGDLVSTVTLSLEQSDKPALRVAADACGITLPESMQSEAVLASRHRAAASRDSFEALPDRIRFHYDQALFERTGHVCFAGNPLAGRQDSMRFIDDNHDIVEEHMAMLRALEARLDVGAVRDHALEQLRRRTAAALDERLHGGAVVSISDGSVSDRLSTGEYGGDCAIGVASGAQEAMGLAQGKHTTNCPLCGTRGVTATVEGETITCSDCRGSVDICTGKVTHGKPKSNKSFVSSPRKTKQTDVPSRRSLQSKLNQQYGENVELKKQRTIGGAETLVLNRRGEVLATL